ncbi:MAG: hypothetical protein Q9227_006319 [Pyrenula ochraceoflavens]
MLTLRLQHTFLLLALARLGSSQISGIDAVNTSSDQFGHPECVIGNFTSHALGIASFSVASISQTLTWTVALSSTPDSSNQSQLLYDRNYILGAPKTAKLTDSRTFHGCALFFEGMTPSLSFQDANNETSTGSCIDALPVSCINDVIKLAQTEGKIAQNQRSNSTLSVCSALQHRIGDSMPNSCNAVKSGWNNILVKDLTGPTAAPLLRVGSCYPTTGTNYEFSLVESFRRASAPEYELIEPFESGVTPVLTAFYNSTSDSFITPDVDLTCLKALTSTAGETNDISSKSAKSPSDRMDIAGAGYLALLLSFTVGLFLGLL